MIKNLALVIESNVSIYKLCQDVNVQHGTGMIRATSDSLNGHVTFGLQAINVSQCKGPPKWQVWLVYLCIPAHDFMLFGRTIKTVPQQPWIYSPYKHSSLSYLPFLLPLSISLSPHMHIWDLDYIQKQSSSDQLLPACHFFYLWLARSPPLTRALSVTLALLLLLQIDKWVRGNGVF